MRNRDVLNAVILDGTDLEHERMLSFLIDLSKHVCDICGSANKVITQILKQSGICAENTGIPAATKESEELVAFNDVDATSAPEASSTAAVDKSSSRSKLCMLKRLFNRLRMPAVSVVPHQECSYMKTCRAFLDTLNITGRELALCL